MTDEQSAEDTLESASVTRLCRYTGLSIFWLFMLGLVSEVVRWLFTTHSFEWNFTVLLMFWMAYEVKNGNMTACKWGVFCMSLGSLASIAIIWGAIINPAQFEFHNNLRVTARPVYMVGYTVSLGWCLVNLKYLLRILKLCNVHYWTRGVIVGHVIFALLLIALTMPPLVLNRIQGYSKSAIKAQYADVIDYLKKTARNEASTVSNDPEVLALTEAHPNIILASINCRGSIISRYNFTTKSVWGNRGTGTDGNGNKISFVTYKECVQDFDDKWVELELWIRRAD